MPDYKPGIELVEKIKPKCNVLYFPINFPKPEVYERLQNLEDKPLHIVWAHRWFV